MCFSPSFRPTWTGPIRVLGSTPFFKFLTPFFCSRHRGLHVRRFFFFDPGPLQGVFLASLDLYCWHPVQAGPEAFQELSTRQVCVPVAEPSPFFAAVKVKSNVVSRSGVQALPVDFVPCYAVKCSAFGILYVGPSPSSASDLSPSSSSSQLRCPWTPFPSSSWTSASYPLPGSSSPVPSSGTSSRNVARKFKPKKMKI